MPNCTFLRGTFSEIILLHLRNMKIAKESQLIFSLENSNGLSVVNEFQQKLFLFWLFWNFFWLDVISSEHFQHICLWIQVLKLVYQIKGDGKIMILCPDLKFIKVSAKKFYLAFFIGIQNGYRYYAKSGLSEHFWDNLISLGQLNWW